MDREKFKAAMESDVEFTYSESCKICRAVAKTQTLDINVIWAIEEMAELQQALVKYMRGFDNLDDVLQEMADVRIALEILQSPDKNGVSLVMPKDMDKAVDVKLDRDIQRTRNP